MKTERNNTGTGMFLIACGTQEAIYRVDNPNHTQENISDAYYMNCAWKYKITHSESDSISRH
jgi:hypothetical protein